MTSSRLSWIDQARGAAIVLVLVSHSTTLLRFGYEVPDVMALGGDLLSPYRMPALAFLSGLLAHLSLRKSRNAFFSGKVRNILWPYIVWTLVFSVTIGSSFSFTDYEMYISYVWYLGYIFAYYTLAYLLRSVPLVALLVATLSIAAFIPVEIDAPRRFFYLYAFFLLGQFAGRHQEQWQKSLASPWVIALVIPLTLTTVAILSQERVRYAPEWFAGAAAGVFLMCSVAYRLSKIPQGKRLGATGLASLGFLGQNSLVFYVTHYPIIYGCVLLMPTLGISEPGVAFLIALSAALTAGTLLVALRRFVVVDVLFTIPGRDRFKVSRRKSMPAARAAH